MSAPTVRTYGGWRRSRGMGLLGLGPAQTLTVLGAVTVLILAGTLSLTALAVSAPVCLTVLGGLLLRFDGVPLAAGLVRRLRWAWGAVDGQVAYRSGSMVVGEHAWALPGVLAATTLLEIPDPGGDVGVVWHRRLGTMTVTLRCAASSTWLADPEQSATWVANWGGWLAGLGYLPIVAWVAVTVDTAPDPGSRLADAVAVRIAPHGPASAQRVLRNLVAVSPAAAADVETRVSVTMRPASSPTRPRDRAEALAEVARTLPGLAQTLGGCGLTVLGPASATDLAAVVRGAFDPATRAELARLADPARRDALAAWLDWNTAGPVAAEEHRDRYVHDTGVSVSWAWHEAPRQQVHADVLARLLAPGPFPKRVTLLYRPLPAGDAARVVEREVNAAAFRAAYHRAQRRDESARDHTDRAHAVQSAHEEATGAGVGLVSLFATVTVTDPGDLDRAVADLETRADTAKIRLRRMVASQAAGFATTLPAGICPPQLARHWPH